MIKFKINLAQALKKLQVILIKKHLWDLEQAALLSEMILSITLRSVLLK